jgi:hypothetical protein
MKKKVPQNKTSLGRGKEKIKCQHEFTTFISPGTGRDEKGTSIDTSSIHIGALVQIRLICRIHYHMMKYCLILLDENPVYIYIHIYKQGWKFIQRKMYGAYLSKCRHMQGKPNTITKVIIKHCLTLVGLTYGSQYNPWKRPPCRTH